MKVEKRDGRIAEFKERKIYEAIIRAMVETPAGVDEKLAKKISERIAQDYRNVDVISIETIQDIVEVELMNSARKDVAKRYIIYREERAKVREKGWDMTDLQRDIYQQKYRYNNESFREFLDRVSGGNNSVRKLIATKRFLPAGRILAGRGLNERGRKVCYSNCFVGQTPQDNLESIFDTAKRMGRTYSYGGGVGITIEKLRPKGARVNNAAIETSGAVSFMELYSTTTGLIGMKARRGALMISLPVSHPDIEEFIEIKSDLTKITKANISVMVSDDFMRAVQNDEEWEMKFVVEDTGEEIIKKAPAKKIFRKLAETNWNVAEPGILYWDRVKNWHINSENPEFEYASTNPCQPKGEYILTRNGYRKIEDIVDHVVLEGKTYRSTEMFKTGTKEVYKVELENGSIIRMTDNHVISTPLGDKPLSEIKVGEKVLVDYTPIYDTEITDIDSYNKGILLAKNSGEINYYEMNKEEKLGFVLGLLDVAITENNLVYVKCEKELKYSLQRLLIEFGVYSEITEDRLYIYEQEVRKLKGETILENTDINLENKKKELKIKSVEFDCMEDVYDITVDEVHHYNTNGLVVHNCGV